MRGLLVVGVMMLALAGADLLRADLTRECSASTCDAHTENYGKSLRIVYGAEEVDGKCVCKTYAWEQIIDMVHSSLAKLSAIEERLECLRELSDAEC